MQFVPCIRIDHLSYSIPSHQLLFEDLSLALGPEKTGLVGRNGVGKSTLLKLILGTLVSDMGSIEVLGRVAYCPQQLEIKPEKTLADVFGVADKLQALQRIIQGSVDETDFLLVNDDWNLQERIQQQLTELGLSHLNLDRKFSTLSGGERTRIVLAKAFLAKPDFIVLDEPTNNLDAASREFLYAAIKQWQGGMLVVSHDRTLLNLMERIIELTSLGIKNYGGNYDYFVEQNAINRIASERELFDAKKELQKTKSSIQSRHESQEQKDSYGRRQFLAGKLDKITANSSKGRSEKTQNRHAKLNESLLKVAEEKLQAAKAKIEIAHEINIAMPSTFVPNGKMVLEIEDLVFGYEGDVKPIIKDFNLKVMGPEHIALLGNNGSGKTTLVKLMLGELKPVSGYISLGVRYVNYLDQHANLLDPNLSILDNFIKLNPAINTTDARFYLADFLFRGMAALKLVKDLSGGEQLRAVLACVLMSQHPPQLLILDEPTNHLDLDSITSIESALKHYQGALLVISHDHKFLDNIKISRTIWIGE